MSSFGNNNQNGSFNGSSTNNDFTNPTNNSSNNNGMTLRSGNTTNGFGNSNNNANNQQTTALTDPVLERIDYTAQSYPSGNGMNFQSSMWFHYGNGNGSGR